MRMAIATEGPVSIDAGAGTAFAAATEDGEARLSLPGSARHAADAAIALGRAEVLLRAIDAWTGRALDWRWVDTRGDGAGVGSTASDPVRRDPRRHDPIRHDPIRHDPIRHDPIRLDLPAACLRRLPAPPPELHDCLSFASHPAILVLARFALAADEVVDIAPGAAVLLVESMAGPWRGVLRPAEDAGRPGSGLPLLWRSPHDASRIAWPADPADLAAGPEPTPGVDAFELRRDGIGVVPPLWLVGGYAGHLGGSAGEGAGEGLGNGAGEGAAASLWRCGTGAGPVAAGRLVPWADGWALIVDAT